MKYISNTKLGRYTVNRSLATKTKSTYKGFVSLDPTREPCSDENGLLEYATDNDMIEYREGYTPIASTDQNRRLRQAPSR